MGFPLRQWRLNPFEIRGGLKLAYMLDDYGYLS